jgi:hypothetical protein
LVRGTVGERTVGVVERRWAVALVLVTELWAVVLALAPTGSTSTCDTAGCTDGHTNLLTTEGNGVLLVLAVPVVLTVVAALVPSTPLRYAVAGLLTTLAFLGMLTIGPTLLPTVALAWGLAGYSTSARSVAK